MCGNRVIQGLDNPHGIPPQAILLVCSIGLSAGKGRALSSISGITGLAGIRHHLKALDLSRTSTDLQLQREDDNR